MRPLHRIIYADYTTDRFISQSFFLVSAMATATAVMPPANLPRIIGSSISGAKPAVKPRWSPNTKAADTAKAILITLQQKLTESLVSLGMTESIRGERLSTEDFVNLANLLTD